MAVANTQELPARPNRTQPWFRRLTLLTVLSTFTLVVLGAVVRVTNSGLGCPDWPLCHGGILPPLESQAVIEYSHRVIASFLVGPLILATVAGAWLAFRHVLWLIVPATMALVMLVAQAILGGITVLNELPGGTVAAHLALGQALLASLILVSVVAHRGPLRLPPTSQSDERPDRFPFLLLAAGAGIYFLLLSGSYVTITGATGACLSWPLCQGDVFPEHRLQTIHMAHRLVAAVIGVFVIYVLHIGIREKHRLSTTRFLSMAIAGLLIAQMIIGAGTVWADFSVEMRGLHFGVATAVWGMLAWLITFNFTQHYDPTVETSHA